MSSPHSTTTAPAVRAAAAPPAPCAAERTPSARLGAWLFRHRGWLPLTLLPVPLLVGGTEVTGRHWAIGILLLLVGESVRMAGVAAAGSVTRRRSRVVSELVTHGPFALSRNPLYVGNFIIWMGMVVVSGVLWFLPIAALIFAVEYSFIVRYEEGVLESCFGAEYLEYKGRVPRWLPHRTTSVAGELDWAGAARSEISTFLQYVVLLGAFALKDYLVRR